MHRESSPVEDLTIEAVLEVAYEARAEEREDQAIRTINALGRGMKK